MVEQVYNRYYDTVGNYHWTGVHSGDHILRKGEQMNCVTEGCRHVKWLDCEFKELKYLKRTLIPYCELGKAVSYPFIDDGKKDMRCKHFAKEERREDERNIRHQDDS